MSRRWSPVVALGLLLPALAVTVTHAQTPTQMAQVQQMLDRLTKPGVVLSMDEAKEVRGVFDGLGIDLSKAKPDQKAKVLACDIYTAAMIGNAEKLLEPSKTLATELADQPGGREAAYFAALVTGNGELARSVAKDGYDKATGDDKKLWSQRRQYAADIGKPAPDASFRVDDATEIKPNNRGDTVLVIDFWNVLSPPPAASLAGLKKVYDEWKSESNNMFVGVNCDSESRVERARKYAADNGLAWQHRYEQKAVGAPITHQAFKVAATPWTVIIDTLGQIRFVGDPAGSAFACTLRCAVAEARGEHPAMTEKRRSGKVDEPTVAKKKDDKAEGDLPSNADAAAKMNLVRTYWKTGKKGEARKILQEIIANYPGTREAKEAKDWLENYP